MPDNPSSCPLCGSEEIYYQQMHAQEILRNTGGSIFDWPKLDLHVCGDCGYVRYFVPQDTLKNIRKRWQRLRIVPSDKE